MIDSCYAVCSLNKQNVKNLSRSYTTWVSSAGTASQLEQIGIMYCNSLTLKCFFCWAKNV